MTAISAAPPGDAEWLGYSLEFMENLPVSSKKTTRDIITIDILMSKWYPVFSFWIGTDSNRNR